MSAPFSGTTHTVAGPTSLKGRRSYQPTLFTETRLRPLGPQMPTGRRQIQLQRITAFASHVPIESNPSNRQFLPLKPALNLNNT